MMEEGKKSFFKAKKESFFDIMELYREILHDQPLDTKNKKKFELALEEATINIINYAYNKEDKGVEVSYYTNPKENILTFEIRDQGIPFNPFEKKVYKKSKNCDEAPEGGVGIFLIKELTDKFEYQLENGYNTLRLSKKLLNR